METQLYNIHTQKKLTQHGSFFNNIFSPLSWNFINFQIFPYHTNKLNDLLQKLNISENGEYYYLNFSGGSNGTIAIFSTQIILENNNIVWVIPFSNIKGLSIKNISGMKKILFSTQVVLKFMFGNTLKKYSFSIPIIATGVNIPINSNDNNSTIAFYNNLHAKLNTIL